MAGSPKDIRVSFPGGKRVDAHYGDRVVQTDQSVQNGGEGSAPEPFDLFFVSMATCVGIYVLEFCTARNLDITGLGVRLYSEKNPERKRYDRIQIRIALPKGFPEKYRNAIQRTADLCTVKKHILEPPEFEIQLVEEAIRQETAQ
jgi:ribosomal protein S12 methylthiotransferase accessory factor